MPKFKLQEVVAVRNIRDMYFRVTDHVEPTPAPERKEYQQYRIGPIANPTFEQYGRGFNVFEFELERVSSVVSALVRL